MKTNSTRQQLLAAVAACEDKKAENLAVLEMDKATSAFTDYFVICSGSNPRQIQAISDEVEQRLARAGQRPTHVEGYQKADWVLLDYVDFVVHVFSPQARSFYDLERLWKSAKRLTHAELASPKRKKTAAKPAARPKTRASRASTRSRSARKRVRKAS
ncbi:MAG TPA: ribosome silencing factor [Terriglobales bacterium]|jgi:ribosome-associated protein|nr:ribosome silencing factor [Terriglobales bacterium]